MIKGILSFFRFSWPYLRRYWFRFSAGIFLGFLFGASNGLTLGCVSLILNRLNPPVHAAPVATAEESGQTVGPSTPDEPSNSAFQRELGRIKQEMERVNLKVKEEIKQMRQDLRPTEDAIFVVIDPWLPQNGRDLDWKQVLGGFLLFPLVAALRGGIGYASSYCLAWAGQRITNDVKTDAFKKINTLSLDYFHKTTSSALLMRTTGDAMSLNAFLKLGLSDLIKEPSTIVFVFVVMLFNDWKLTLIAMVFLPICVIPTRKISKKIKAQGRMDITASIRQNDVALESFQNNRITKAYGLEAAHTEAFRQAGLAESRYSMRVLKAQQMLNPIIETFSMMGVGAVILYVIWARLSPETLGTFLMALVLFLSPFKKLNSVYVYISQMQIGLSRLMELFALQPTVREDPNAVALPRFERGIQFKDVSFSYGEGDVLSRVSFSLDRGKRLGLAGESGSGKSSLINLLFRFYDPTSGVIEFDGHPLPTVRVADLRSHMALVSQDILLFNKTVAENISFGKLGVSREEIIDAARRAHAHEFISELAQGYDTSVGERGVRLSGGQRQRIAIARAFVRNAPILVLDEATASLDSQAEAEIQKTIDELAANRTVLCVAHRLSTLRTMDEIIVMEKGLIIEQGGFDALLRQNQAFAAMAALQGIYASAAA
jgi:subfamily B ATP-binding cassette protein MsbA